MSGITRNAAGVPSTDGQRKQMRPIQTTTRQESLIMFTKQLATALIAVTAATASLGLAGSARANEADYQDPFMLFKMAMLDKNKDGMVSKKEFMAMVEKAYDMKAKQMGVKGGLMTEEQVQALLKSLYYVGGN
ncbi:MAG: EF-hand domain-containing protein [Piscinibacter sp.]|nr:EF-hand domain-containing protein [Piscinibacter sp.]